MGTGDPYKLRISRKTVDKLGVKLYDKVALVIAELVSNAYDADAPAVTVRAPMGEFLATRRSGDILDKGFTVEVVDSGLGMTPDELQNYYLVVGADRRTDPNRGDKSPGGRPVTGRKGVGKLAPFGICKTIEVISAGGQKVQIKGKTGYHTAHIVMQYDAITSEDETDYEPVIGDLDRTLSATTGTRIILKDFWARKVPDMERLSEELAQRFGLDTGSDNWKVILENNRPGFEESRTLSTLDIPVLDDTRVEFQGPRPTLASDDHTGYSVVTPKGSSAGAFSPGFNHEGRYYPIVGWIAFSRSPVKNEYHAGVRIYCRGKFATQTLSFDIAAGFTGELNVRSYLVGEIHCDWLDEDEDLIHTDRQNILWSTDVGVAFQDWGQRAIRELARLGRKPAQKRTVEIFSQTVELNQKLLQFFPDEQSGNIRKRAHDLAEQLASRLSPTEAGDPEAAQGVLNLVVAFAPHAELSEELRRAAIENETPTIAAVADVLKKARFAEGMTLGSLVGSRLKLIDRFENLVNSTATDEAAVQELLERAPWLIRPEWTPISANKSLKTVRRALETFLSGELKKDVVLSAIENPTKRPDFVMISGHGTLELVEIKKPQYKFASNDLERLYNYVTALDSFFSNPAHRDLLDDLRHFRITLICDGQKLKSVELGSYDNLITKGKLQPRAWSAFVKDTRRIHQSFLDALKEPPNDV